jgi:hypothetical protein
MPEERIDELESQVRELLADREALTGYVAYLTRRLATAQEALEQIIEG